MKPRRLHPVAPSGAAARAFRRVSPRALAALTALAAACGGGDGGGGGIAGPSSTQARLDLTATTTLAQGTTGATVRVVPVYERTSGERVALATQSGAVTGTPQNFPFNVDISACLNDPARRGADQGTGANAVCQMGAAVTLVGGQTTLDSAFVGPFSVKGGGSATAAVSLVEVTSVTVTLAGGGAVGTQPLPLQVGQTLGLAGSAVGPNNAAVTRAIGWTSSAPGVATVDAATGVITAAGVGTAKITATAGGRTTSVDVVVRGPLTVSVAGAGNVKSAPAGIDCSATGAAGCTALFDPNATVTLTPTAAATSTFGGWSGDCTGTGACTVAIDRARAVTATFAAKRVALNVTVGGTGSGTVTVTGGNVAPTTACGPRGGQASVSCAYTIDAGALVNLTTAASAGSVPGVWGGACADVGSARTACGKPFSADANVSVTFGPRPAPDSITVNAVGTQAGQFGGTLSVTGFVNGQPTATQISFGLTTTTGPVGPLEFDPASPVTLRFQPDGSSRTVSWGGVCNVNNSTVDATGTSTCTFNSVKNSQASLTLSPR